MDEKAQLAGRWKVLSCESHGERIPEKHLVAEAMLSISGDLFVVRTPDTPWCQGTIWARGTIRIGDGAAHKQIDLVHTGWGTQLGIYRLDGDQLLMCLAKPGDERPVDFTTSPPRDYALWCLMREKLDLPDG